MVSPMDYVTVASTLCTHSNLSFTAQGPQSNASRPHALTPSPETFTSKQFPSKSLPRNSLPSNPLPSNSPPSNPFQAIHFPAIHHQNTPSNPKIATPSRPYSVHDIPRHREKTGKPKPADLVFPDLRKRQEKRSHSAVYIVQQDVANFSKLIESDA